MFAHIQSIINCTLTLRVKENPVFENSEFKVYELSDSEYPDKVIKIVGGNIKGEYRHFAIDNTGQLHYFNINEMQLSGNLGPCRYIPDSPSLA